MALTTALPIYKTTYDLLTVVTPMTANMPRAELADLIKDLTAQMMAAARDLQFELAARIRDEIADLLNSAFPEIFGVLQAQGVQIAGPPFAQYGMGEEAFDVTAGFPVATAVEPTGRVEMGELPGGEVATTVHVGSYEGLAGAFHAVTEWAATNGRHIAGDPRESYLDGPEVPEPRTMVCFPLEGR